ncbi:Protein AGENET DOMAIN (AGD)-CONTAINING P1 [Linum perenne]
MLTSELSAGDEVEFVRRDFATGQLSYYLATVLRSPAKQHNMILIEYHTILHGSMPAKELIYATSVRPAPPTEYVSWFQLEDDVDVYIAGGWYRGTVKDIDVNSNYLVSFARQGDEIVAEQCNMRHHREWNDGAWFPPSPPLLPPRKRSVDNPKPRKMRPAKKTKKTSKALMSKGARVEVKIDDPGFQGAWFDGLVIDHVGSDKYVVEYLHLLTEDETGKLREVVNAEDVRPCPPVDQTQGRYKVHDRVDAWCNDGWWEGMIVRVLDALNKYMVYFTVTRDTLELESSILRPHMDWVNGKWVKDMLLEEPEESNNTVESDNPSYRIGMEVEAKSDEAGFRGAWFTGMIVAVLGNDRFLVQYDNLVTDDETDYLKEEVNASDLRPRPPQVPIPNLYPLLEVVDAWSNDAWWVGHIVRVCKNEATFKYRVVFWTKEELEFDHSQLRPHLEWVDGEWCSVPQEWKL